MYQLHLRNQTLTANTSVTGVTCSEPKPTARWIVPKWD